MKSRIDFPDYKGQARKAKAAIAKFGTLAANAALNFYIDSFNRQGFIDQKFKRWPTRSRLDEGRKTLVNRGKLRASLRSSTSPTQGGWVIAVSTNSKYAKIHNESGSIEITPNMRKFFWAMYYKHGGKKAAAKDDSRAAYYRALALAKGPIEIKQRQFMDIPGKPMSTHLRNRLALHFKKLLDQAYK